jgi:hypothetical protein
MKLYFLVLLAACLAVAPAQAGNLGGGTPAPLGGGTGTTTTYNFITNLKAFPNPTSNGAITVSFLNRENQNLTIRVYNLLGKEVIKQEISGDDINFETQIDLGDFSRGVYILEVSNGAQIQTKRISFI